MAKVIETAEASGRLAELAGRVAARGKQIIVQRRGQPLAVLVGLEEYKRLQSPTRRKPSCRVPPELLERQRALVAQARRLRVRHGDPVEGMGEFLKSLPPPTDPFWAELAETPS